MAGPLCLGSSPHSMAGLHRVSSLPSPDILLHPPYSHILNLRPLNFLGHLSSQGLHTCYSVFTEPSPILHLFWLNPSHVGLNGSASTKTSLVLLTCVPLHPTLSPVLGLSDLTHTPCKFNRVSCILSATLPDRHLSQSRTTACWHLNFPTRLQIA